MGHSGHHHHQLFWQKNNPPRFLTHPSLDTHPPLTAGKVHSESDGTSCLLTRFCPSAFYRSGLSEILLQPDGRCRIDVCSYYRQIAMSKAVSSMSLGKQARQQLSLSFFMAILPPLLCHLTPAFHSVWPPISAAYPGDSAVELVSRDVLYTIRLLQWP